MAAEAEINQARFERTTVDIKPLKASNVPIIFVIGGPGCGKGTQCERIVKRYGFTHLSTGDLLREEVESGSKRGQKMSAIMKKGELVPLDVVLDLLKEAMMKHLSKTKGYLIDGFPREIAQGVEFEKQVNENLKQNQTWRVVSHNSSTVIKPCTMVLFFDVSDKTMLERCLKRGQTSGRVDDNEDTIRKRLATFHGVSKPVVEFYKNKVKIVNGDKSIDEVFVNACEFISQVIYPRPPSFQPKKIFSPPAKLPNPTSTRLTEAKKSEDTPEGSKKFRKNTPWVSTLTLDSEESWEESPKSELPVRRSSRSTTKLLKESITILERIKSERSLYDDKEENNLSVRSDDVIADGPKADEVTTESADTESPESPESPSIVSENDKKSEKEDKESVTGKQ